MANSANNWMQDLMKNPALAKLMQNSGVTNYLNNSPEGKRLMELLSQDGGTAQNAAAAAAKGDMSGIAQIISRLNSTPEGANILGKINQEIRQNNNK